MVPEIKGSVSAALLRGGDCYGSAFAVRGEVGKHCFVGMVVSHLVQTIVYGRRPWIDV